MKKTIKIIDLLNLCINGKYNELPKQIKWKQIVYNLYQMEYGYCYYTSKDNIVLLEKIVSFAELNDEVEIIKEDKKIEKISDFVGYTTNELIDNVREIKNKINELIDKVNKLESEVNK